MAVSLRWSREQNSKLMHFWHFLQQNIEFLRECGVQEWILDGDESFKDFFAWFNNNISRANILTNEELVEWVDLFVWRPGVRLPKIDLRCIFSVHRRNDMIKANKYFTDDELKAETAKIAEQYEGIWEYTDTDVIKLERELEQLSIEEELYEDLVTKMK